MCIQKAAGSKFFRALQDGKERRWDAVEVCRTHFPASASASAAKST